MKKLSTGKTCNLPQKHKYHYHLFFSHWVHIMRNYYGSIAPQIGCLQRNSRHCVMRRIESNGMEWNISMDPLKLDLVVLNSSDQLQMNSITKWPQHTNWQTKRHSNWMRCNIFLPTGKKLTYSNFGIEKKVHFSKYESLFENKTNANRKKQQQLFKAFHENWVLSS